MKSKRSSSHVLGANLGVSSYPFDTNNLAILKSQLSMQGNLDLEKIDFKPLFCFFDKTDSREAKWKRPLPDKFEDRPKITTLTPEKKKERAIQLWAIGIRKARIMTVIMRVIKSVDDNLKIFGASKGLEENISFETEYEGVKC